MAWVFANLVLCGIVAAAGAVLYFGFTLIHFVGFSAETERHIVGALALIAVFIPGLVARAALKRLAANKS